MPNLSDDMLSALTKQAACEAYNSNTYLQIALFWDGLNYGGSKLLKYISINYPKWIMGVDNKNNKQLQPQHECWNSSSLGKI